MSAQEIHHVTIREPRIGHAVHLTRSDASEQCERLCRSVAGCGGGNGLFASLDNDRELLYGAGQLGGDGGVGDTGQ